MTDLMVAQNVRIDYQELLTGGGRGEAFVGPGFCHLIVGARRENREMWDALRKGSKDLIPRGTFDLCDGGG